MSGNQSSIAIREATLNDADAICRVHIASVRVLCALDYTPAQIEAWVGRNVPENYRKAMQYKGETMFVAEIQGAIAGFSSLHRREVCAIYVHPACTRRGVGTRLLNAVEQAAIARGIHTLRLDASVTAIPFYTAQGYAVVERSRHTFWDGTAVPCAKMKKQLSSDGAASARFL